MSLPTFEVTVKSGQFTNWRVSIRRNDGVVFWATFGAESEPQARDIAQGWAKMMEAVLKLPDAPLAEPFRRP